MSASGTGASTGVISGDIAARLDRLPLTRPQYGPAAITQIFWGLIIATDGMPARLYPFLGGDARHVHVRVLGDPGRRHRRRHPRRGVSGRLPGPTVSAGRRCWSPHRWSSACAIQVLFLAPRGLFGPRESPRRLEGRGRHEDADRIVTRWEKAIARRTGPLPEPDSGRHPVVTTERVPARELFVGTYGRRSVGTGWTDGVGHIGGVAGAVAADLAVRDPAGRRDSRTGLDMTLDTGRATGEF